MKKIAIITLLILCLTVFVACKTTENDSQNVAVTFYLNNGEAPITVLASDGFLHSDVCPAPKYDDHDFVGWFFNEERTERVSFPLEVKENISVYASWLKRSGVANRATFVTNGGSAVGDYYGKTVESAPSTAREGYTLQGWYLDPEYSALAYFPYTLDRDTTFYAKFDLTGVAFDTDEGANTLVFRWPAVEGAKYEVTATNYRGIEVFTSNGVATCSLSVKDGLPFTVEIDKNTAAGKNEIFRKAFAKYDDFDLSNVEIDQRGEDVVFSFNDKVGVYQIIVYDPRTDNETIYTSSAKTFNFPSTTFSKEKSVSFRNVKDDPQTLFYSFRSDKLSFSRYDTPVFGRYRDPDSNISWQGVGEDVSYTLSFYVGDEIVREERAVGQSTDSSGYVYYDFSPASLFPAGEYGEFGVSVTAARKFDDDGRVYVLSSAKGEINKVSFVGAAKIELKEDKIVWNDLTDAASYDVELKINGVIDKSQSKTFNRNDQRALTLTTGGSYDISVKPNARDLNKYTVPASETYDLLDMPEIIVSVGSSSVKVGLKKEVPNALYYAVNIVKSDGSYLKTDTIYPPLASLDYSCVDFGAGDYQLEVVAVGGGSYNNSPASYAKIVRLAKPEIEFIGAGTSMTVRLTVPTGSKYHITYKGLSGFQDREEEDEGVKVLTFEQSAGLIEDQAFEMSVYAKRETSVIAAGTTHNPLNATTYYIDSEKEIKTIYALRDPEEFRLQNENTLSWNTDAVKAKFEVKLDDKNADGLVLPMNSTSVDISAVLAYYGESVLKAGTHTFYLRRILDGNSVLFSGYSAVQVTKLRAAKDLTFINKILNWTSDNESVYGYKLIWTSGNDDYVVYNPDKFDLPNNCLIEMNERTRGSTEMNFKVVCLGNLAAGVLDSEPSEGYLIKRLEKPVLAASDGVLSWQGEENGRYEVFDGDTSLRTLNENSFDVKTLGAGRYYLTVKSKSDDADTFDSELSAAFDAVVLKTPTIKKIEETSNGYRIGAVLDRGADSEALYYELSASELKEPLRIKTSTISDAVFYPDENGTLAAGKYALKLRAVGNGVNVVTSDYSNELVYYKLEVPQIEIDYVNEIVTFRNGDLQDAYVVDEYVGRLNSAEFSNDDRSAANFNKYSLEAASEGENVFSVRAISYGNVSSNVLTVPVRRLYKPVISQTPTALSSDVEETGETYFYTLNGSQEVSSDVSEWAFSDLSLEIGENVFTFYRRAAGRLDSPVGDYSLTKLAAPTLSFDFDSEEVKWSKISLAEDYVCILRDSTKRVTDSNVSFAYRAGENFIEVYAAAEGKVNSNVSTIKVEKLFAPVIEGRGGSYSWSVPYGAEEFIVSQNSHVTTTSANVYELDPTYIGDGINTLTVVATADKRISSDPASATVSKLLAPKIYQKADGLYCDTQVEGEEYVYTLNSNASVTSSTGEWLFKDLSLSIGDNSFKVYRKAEDYLDSGVSETYHFTKLAAPSPSLNVDNEVVWGAVDGATDYEYTFGGKTYSTSATSLALDFGEGDNWFVVRAICEGKVPSNLVSVNFVKLSSPVVKRAGLDFSWEAVVGATGYVLSLNGVDYDTVDKTYCSVDESDLSPGVNAVRVVALGGSNVVSSKPSLSSAFDKLYEPVFISVGDKIVWEKVPNADGYYYEFNGASATTTECFVDLDIPLTAGTYTFSVIATGSDYDSDVSSFDFVRLPAPDTSVTGDVLSWDTVEGAFGYKVYVDGDLVYTGSATNYSLTGEETEIRVAAYNEIIGVFAVLT